MPMISPKGKKMTLTELATRLSEEGAGRQKGGNDKRPMWALANWIVKHQGWKKPQTKGG